jgi:hypothetical protein
VIARVRIVENTARLPGLACQRRFTAYGDLVGALDAAAKKVAKILA